MSRFRIPCLGLALLVTSGNLAAVDPQPNTLTEKEIAKGWLLIFDGETTFGWKAVESAAKKPEMAVKDGVLKFSGTDSAAKFTTQFRYFEMSGEYRAVGKGVKLACEIKGEVGTPKITMSHPLEPTSGWRKISAAYKISAEHKSNVFAYSTRQDGTPESSHLSPENFGPCQLQFVLPKDEMGQVELRNLKLRPLKTTPLFNGKDLTGWKVFPGDKYKSKFDVTADGELSIKNGPGDLQTEKQFDDFVVQLECKTNGKWLNSGLFFRCIADQYQNGYEAQIQNGYKGTDRTKPNDFGTGAIYRRIPARKVVSNDNEWFTMTVVADGSHFATWVNGYETVDWTDERKPNDNPRNGLKTGKGHLSLQGHDPTTNLLFRNIRVAELHDAKAK